MKRSWSNLELVDHQRVLLVERELATGVFLIELELGDHRGASAAAAEFAAGVLLVETLSSATTSACSWSSVSSATTGAIAELEVLADLVGCGQPRRRRYRQPARASTAPPASHARSCGDTSGSARETPSPERNLVGLTHRCRGLALLIATDAWNSMHDFLMPGIAGVRRITRMVGVGSWIGNRAAKLSAAWTSL